MRREKAGCVISVYDMQKETMKPKTV